MELLLQNLNWARKQPLFWLLALSLVVYGCCFWWGLPTSYGGWAVDAIAPVGAIPRYFGELYLIYPPFHRYILFLAYSPVFLLDKLNIISISDLWVNTFLIGLGRLVSVAMAVGTIAFTYLTAKEVFKRDRPAIITTLMVILTAPTVYYSKVVNLEIPYVFWFSISLFAYVRVLKYHRLPDYLLFSTTAVLSVCTKDQAYGLYILPVFYLIVDTAKINLNAQPRKTIKSRVNALLDVRLILPAVSGIVLFCLIHRIGFGSGAFVKHLYALSGASYEADQFFSRPENNVSEHFALAGRFIQQLIFNQGWPVFLTCIFGLILAAYSWRKNWLLMSLLIPVLSYYLFFISIILYSRDRFLIPVCLILSFFGAFFLEFVYSKISEKWIAKLIVICIISYSFFYAFSVNILMWQDSRYVVEDWLRATVSTPASIGYIGPDTYNPRFHYLPDSTAKPIEIQDINDCTTSRQLDYVVTTSNFDSRRFPPQTEQHKIFMDLYAGRTAFQEVFRYQSKPRWNLIRPEQPDSAEYYDYRLKTGNFNKINPEIRVFKRRSPTSGQCEVVSTDN